MMSGTLVSYLTFKELDRNNGKLNIFVFYLHRYIRYDQCLKSVTLNFSLFCRLTGVYAVIVLFHASLMRYLPRGPANFVDLAAKGCQDAWWTNLLYVNNLVIDQGNVRDLDQNCSFQSNTVLQCMGQTWYMANDMQMFWASPFMIVPMWWIHKKKGKLWAGIWSALWVTVFTGILLALYLIKDWPATSLTE